MNGASEKPRAASRVSGSDVSSASDDQSFYTSNLEDGFSLKSLVTSYTAYDASDQPSTNLSKSSHSKPVVAAKEQKAVYTARLAVVAVLIIALVVVTVIMYWVVSKSQREEFTTQFENFASEISSVVQDTSQNAIDSAESFSTMITSSAITMNATWPFVSIPDFSSKVRRLSKLSGAYQISFAPIVYSEDFRKWSTHTVKNAPAVYEEAIKVHGYNTTVQELVDKTVPLPWFLNGLNPFAGPQIIDPTEPEIPIQLIGLRERIGFKGYFVNWQSSEWLEPIYTIFQGTPTTNVELLNAGIEDAFATAVEFNIPAFDSYRKLILDLETMELLRYESQTQMVQPIFKTIYNGERSRKELEMVGALNLLFDWQSLLSSLLAKADIKDVLIVMGSTCSLLARPVTFRVTADAVVEVGTEDLHDTQYDDIGVEVPLFTLDLDPEMQAAVDEVASQQIEATVEGGCISEVIMGIYPTKELEESFKTGTAWKFSLVVGCAFVFTSLVFFFYDIMVKRRQDRVMERIIRQDKIVLNTFPKAIRDKLYKDKNYDDQRSRGSQSQLSGFNTSDNDIFGSGQIAELYPSATVIFADIVGFTAWSSAREPNQVFKLLETIYKEFDKLAYRNNIFKVETVGDCYVAVAGVPEKCENHAISVAKFARDCMHKMPDVVRKLEILLGPDTADLELRIGINTGQVTAGVLRGDRARFQLFGDTVNTAARMESSGQTGCIHVSSSTADALKKAGRHRWVRPRENTVLVKGKGHMQTYFMETIKESIQRTKLAKYKQTGKQTEPATGLTTSLASTIISEAEEETSDSEETSNDVHYPDDDVSGDFEFHRQMTKTDRLVEWNVEILCYLLKQIMVARPENQEIGNREVLAEVENKMRSEESALTTVLDEFKEIIKLPSIEAEEILQRRHPDTITLPPVVITQLRDLLKQIAGMYNENHFHNFEHASHVTASVRKLLTRIVDADGDQRRISNDRIPNGSSRGQIPNGSRHGQIVNVRRNRANRNLEELSGHSYGITSDPLTQFSVVFSAVIHDADHPGVPNVQLVKEKTRVAQVYKKSIAEQNSVELVWELLMSSNYDELRSCIYSNEEELRRFRQLVINTVMATDIVDKELGKLRKNRWEKAFSKKEELSGRATSLLDKNRKATIVIEHLIQASDVSHMMQHWHVYKKWNERFFFEQYDAYKSGRAEKDPAIDWYKGEIGFYDFYVIPLAKKLENCGVFGVSSHEYLDYARNNRDQWVREGEEVVKEYLANYNKSKDPTLKSVV